VRQNADALPHAMDHIKGQIAEILAPDRVLIAC